MRRSRREGGFRANPIGIVAEASPAGGWPSPKKSRRTPGPPVRDSRPPRDLQRTQVDRVRADVGAPSLFLELVAARGHRVEAAVFDFTPEGLLHERHAVEAGSFEHREKRVGLEFRIRSLNRGLGHHCVAPEF